jgi:hypothetical protein
MSVKVITSYNDEDFSEVSEMFYNNFSPDDWDYMIIGEDIREVEKMNLILALNENAAWVVINSENEILATLA